MEASVIQAATTWIKAFNPSRRGGLKIEEQADSGTQLGTKRQLGNTGRLVP